jgi:hypothetical protein
MRSNGHFMRQSMLLVLMAAVGLTACAPIYTLSPQVKESARRYSEVMDDFADQGLLANVLRAKDFAPMNFNDLSSITGALSLSGTLGLTLPFGHYVGNPNASTLLGYKDTASPSFTGSTSPVINIGTLNTQGFMMTMIQPISTTYILSKWNSYPHELLLYLFVKSVRFPNEEDDHAPQDCLALDDLRCARRRVHINSPDDSGAFADFRRLVSEMVEKDSVFGGNVDMKSLMLLDPLGGPVPFGQTLQATTPIPTQSPAAAPTQPPKASAESATTGTMNRTIAGRGSVRYCVRVSYAEAHGAESDLSPEECLNLTASESLRVYAPLKLSPQQRGYYVYVASPPDTETRQLNSPQTPAVIAAQTTLMPFTRNWDEPSSGIASGPPPPPVTSGPFPPNPALAQRTYHVQLTYVTSSGAETVPSPEVVTHLNDNQVLLISPPSSGTTGAIGYNVYVAGTPHDETRQNVQMIPIAERWRETNTGMQRSTAPPPPPGTSYQVNSDYNIIQAINGLNDGQLHAGNSGCPDFLKKAPRGDSNDLCPEGADSPFVRFYKEYPAQVVLCLRTGGDGRFYGHAIAPMSPEERDTRRAFLSGALDLKAEALQDLNQIQTKSAGDHAKQERAIRERYQEALADLEDRLKVSESTQEEVLQSDTGGFFGFLMSAHTPTPAATGASTAGAAGGTPPQGGGGGTGNAPAAGGGAGAMPTVTLALQPSRISAILHEESCQSDEIVLKTGTEEKFGDVSRRFTHIEWRSIAEVIQYLGAVARYQDFSKDPAKFVGWGTGETLTHAVFTYSSAGGGTIDVSYHGKSYSTPSSSGLPKEVTDHSLQALALLNELISIAKISGTLPVSQPVQVLP